MAMTERQIQRRDKSLETFHQYESQNKTPQWIGQIWNHWRDQALAYGASPEEATETADQVMFGIPESDQANKIE